MSALARDVRHTVRLMLREPGYTAVAVLTMALGIGATTILFSVAYGVLLKPLPWPDADRIVRVTETRQGRTGRLRGTITNGSYLAWTEQPTTIEALGGYSVVPGSMTLRRGGAGDPVRVAVGRMTPSLFRVLNAAPLRGRVFIPEDAQIGSGAYPNPRVIILSYGLWQELFGGRDSAIGSVVRTDGLAVTVVGVMPRGFLFPDRDTRAWLPMPIGTVLGEGGVRRMMIFGALARLRPGVTFAQAAAEATARARTAPDPGLAAVSLFGSAAPPEIAITSAVDAMTADVRPAISLLLAAVLLLLATATANVGSLQLARATVRRREIAVRAAIGAGRVHLVQQMLIESGLVGLAGGAAGLLLALALHRLLPVFLPVGFPRIEDIAIDPVVLLFSLGISIGASVACGTLPALQALKLAPIEALADSARTSAAGVRRSRTGRLRTLLMTGQVAVACVLLVGATLLTRSFVALMHADRGYDPSNLLTARLDLGAEYDAPRRVAFADRVLARLRNAPGVANAAAGNALPFVSLGGNAAFRMPSPGSPEIAQDVQALTRVVSPGYFDTLRLRLIAGRPLTETDTASSRPVVVVSRSFARRYLGSEAVGARLPMSFGEGRPDCDVVGVVDDMRQSSVTDPPAPELFVSYRQMPARLVSAPMLVILRTTDDPLAHVALVREAVRELDASVALDSVMTMEERVVTSLAQPRLYAALLGAFACCALVIAGVGLFSVLSYAVAQRAREIGVRTALGARTRDIVALVLEHGAIVSLAGVALGCAGSVTLSTLLASFLYGVAAYDLASYAAVAALVLMVSAVACIVPARRAARVDPLVVLRAN